MAERAYGAEDKAVRRRVILDAGAALFADGSGGLPPVAAIAEAASLAKGTVYLYFRTKEAIFAAVLQDGWLDAIELVVQTFADPKIGRTKRAQSFLSRFVSHIVQHPELLRLDALGHAVLMRNLDLAALVAFRGAIHDRIEEGGAAVERALDLPAGRGAQLLARTYGLTRGLWRSFDEAVASRVDVPAKYPSGFAVELAEALAEYWRGALARPVNDLIRPRHAGRGPPNRPTRSKK